MILNNGMQKYVEFGTGDIRIASGIINGAAVLGLNEEVKGQEIGILTETQETVQTIQQSEVYMVFNSLKSLEVLILKLQESRSLVINGIDYEFDKPKNLTDIYEPNSIIKG